MTDRSAVRYRIRPKSPEAHLYEVSVTLEAPDPLGQRFALPAWIPGSYMIREYARHFVTVRAASGGREVRIEKLDKHTWRAERCDGALTVTAEVYAWDLSVRGAHLDGTHGFFNGACVFLRCLGREHEPCDVEILPPRGGRYRAWRVATALARKAAEPFGFGLYAAADYDELIDHPVETGTFSLASFRARGVPHDIAITGRHDADLDRLVRDVRKICETQIDFFGGRAPMDRYVFLVMAVGEGYGGLEHRASTALLTGRDALPQAGRREATDAYRGFLGLVSHEYFHTWNVKRIKPAAFTPYDLDRESYTTLLWAFEGFTSYYDDLLLVRARLMDEAAFLSTWGESLTRILRGSGRLRQSVAESSFDAWIKFYRQDENAPNAVVNYYAKGAAVGLALDLLIRQKTRGRRSLDDVMRLLWERYGRTGAGVPEEGVERAAEEVAGTKLTRFFAEAVHGTADLPLERLLGTVGVKLTVRPAESAGDGGGKASRKSAAQLAGRATLGVRTAGEGPDVKIVNVLDGGPAQAAGVSAGDVVVAVDGLRVSAKALDARLERMRPGQRIKLHLFRRDELHAIEVELAAPPADTCVLEIDAGLKGRARARRAWLAGR
jgi:predicted metalloprotease with PDZ domain